MSPAESVVAFRFVDETSANENRQRIERNLLIVKNICFWTINLLASPLSSESYAAVEARQPFI